MTIAQSPLPFFARHLTRFASRVPVVRLVVAVLAGWILLAGGLAHARPPALVVESVREVSADQTMAEIELVISSDAPGRLNLAATAKSADGALRSAPATADDGLRAGRHQRVTLFIPRPAVAGARHTDVLWVWAWEPINRDVFIGRRVSWPHDWPALDQPKAADAKVAGGGATPVGGSTTLLLRETDDDAFYASLIEEDFTALDLLLQEWNTPAQRNQNGEWKLESFRSAIDTLVANRKWDEVRAVLGRWRRANPHSPGAALAEAEAWWSYAWTLRRCACSPTGNPETLRQFRQRLSHAMRVLAASRRYAAKSPLWYEESLEIVGDGERDKRSPRAAIRLFEAGADEFPQYPPLYLAMADFWAPTDGQHTDWDKVEAVADLAAKRTRDADGDDNYAWVYARVSAHQQGEVDVVRDSALSWPRLRDAFGELVRRHPSADNYNLFALFACRAGDKHSYLNARAKIQGHVEGNLWPDNVSVDVCDHRFMQQT